jgi:hypothetical protein
MSKFRPLINVVFWAASMAAMGYIVYETFSLWSIFVILAALSDNGTSPVPLALILSTMMCLLLLLVSVYKICVNSMLLFRGKK